ncbi:TetR/AcrR family transcriptional regulator [Streptomyces sp. NRRL S-495]|uniref:TetR/AcrR family transcriptional regulator n=1 Tax=Streptomyces sp. NRRL S-495 TaxID=1609133 RepID=UPI0005F90DA1|nr:TetR/AcrR family transcriptional regulator [Streptomyces sp. NRRL S-495]KJY33408.1 TetR family transcriptional regulator [Streptomyces sp. NRRL S-495]
MTTSGMQRPGGRTARVRIAVLKAAEDALVEVGFAGLDLGDVARRAEVGRTTVYRRWGSVGALLADLLTDMAEQSLPRARTGSLAEDLRTNARLVARTLADPRQGALFRAVLVAAACDHDAAEALHRFYRARVEEWAPCVTEAVDRGELPPDTDPVEVVRAVSAPLYYRMLTTPDPLDEATADRAAATTLAAAHAGAFRRPA